MEKDDSYKETDAREQREQRADERGDIYTEEREQREQRADERGIAEEKRFWSIKRIITAAAIGYVILAFGFVVTTINAREYSNRIAEETQARVNATASTTIENCARVNYQDFVDEQQDRTLLKLVISVNQPSSELQRLETIKDFITAEKTIRTRINKSPLPINVILQNYSVTEERDCRKLATIIIKEQQK